MNAFLIWVGFMKSAQGIRGFPALGLQKRFLEKCEVSLKCYFDYENRSNGDFQSSMIL